VSADDDPLPILRLLPDERCEKRHEFNGGQHVLELIESDVLIQHHCWIVRSGSP
jgi:hypothetical protein